MSIIRDSKTDPNKILPMKYLWARKYYKGGIANNWTPEEISMQRDIEQWKSSTALTSQERHMILLNLGFFSTAESLTANNLVLAVYRHVTNPECRQYLLRQAFEEAVHTDTFIYCCDSLGLNPDEIYNMYETVDVIKAKDDFVVNLTKSIFDPSFDIVDAKTTQQFVHDLIGYYVIMEGIFFYAGFAMMLSLKRHNKMVGVGQQFEYIMRDESLHLAFGCDLINTIKAENPAIWTKDFAAEVTELIKKAVVLESAYALDACPDGLLGITGQQFVDYVQHIADRRLERIGLEKVYGTENPFPWMSQSTDLSKEKNFFETRVTEYQSAGSLDWEE
ncbi:ribonucleotide-diphosphate reductase subunit beta [Candidatus Babeliales bacterium]|nr:ribonucleotide-diphosphate reductase subunit beta [Candidatus Babeliales bacterium]MBP9844304.1 ribonucleotide-diphosphate reductase subunit beta [Candidatus Babeliales bacterium]